MAFNPNNMEQLSIGYIIPGIHNSSIAELFSYYSGNDTISTVLVPNYFQPYGFNFNSALYETQLEVNDQIFVQAADGNFWITVTGILPRITTALTFAGFSLELSCYAGTTGNLNATYANGASGVGATLTNAGVQVAFATDTTTPPLNSRILVKDEVIQAYNGIYNLTNTGSLATNWVLTRATDYDVAPSQIFPGNLVVVDNGATLAGTTWIQTASVSTVGTDPIVWSRYNQGQTGLQWHLITANTAMAPNNGYIVDTNAALTLTTPANFNTGDTFAVSTLQVGSFVIQLAGGQTVSWGDVATSAGGTISSTAAGDAIQLVGAVPNVSFTVAVAPQGNLDYT